MNYLVVAAPEKVNLTVAVLLASCPISMYTAKVKIGVKLKNNRHRLTMLASVDSTNHRTTKSRCTRDDKRVYTIVTISRLIGCCWTLDGKAIEIQSYKANI